MKVARLLSVCAAALLLCASIASAQEHVLADSASAARARSRCDSIMTAARMDSVRVQVRAFLLRADGDALPAAPRALILQEIAARLQLPRPLALPVLSAGPTRLRMLRPEGAGERPQPRPPLLYGAYELRLRRDGVADSVRVLLPTLAPAFDSTIVAVVRGASREHALPPLGDEVHEVSVPVQLRITSGVPDPRLGPEGVTLFEAYFPLLRVVDAVPAPSNVPPAYPPEEMDDGEDGEVLLQVVVDEHGAPVLPTAEVLHETSRAFTTAAYRALAAYRFTPARVGTCTVPQQVRVPFWFSLRP